MNSRATAAQTLWLAANLRHGFHFARALRSPEQTQARWLNSVVRREASSRFGEAHGFAKIDSYASFRRSVPLADYRDVEPWIHRIRSGEKDVLTTGAVSHLVPTSGTSGARKLIPFTESLQRAFSAAVGAWLCDLIRQRPRTLLGPGYWAVSPLADFPVAEVSDSSVPIGFADDADYLTGISRWLVRQALAVPASLRHVKSIDIWKRVTLLCLLRQRDLRLISIWHPSYFQILADEAAIVWDELCEAVAGGNDPWLGRFNAPPDPVRASELAQTGWKVPAAWWQHLQVLSCWGEQAAEPGWRDLCLQFPTTYVQAKGLLATEGVVTLPWSHATPLAITSHFFEFIDDRGAVFRAHELKRGQSYEVVVTNGGGLWRYRLGDRVECTGYVAATPCLRFLGRTGNVSDLRGEKLSEAFVADVLARLWPCEKRPVFGQLQAYRGNAAENECAWYELHVSSCEVSGLAERLDQELCRNPHYAWARQLGQLSAARVVQRGNAAIEDAKCSHGHLAAFKPRVLVNGATVQR